MCRDVIAKKRAEVSRLRGVESVMLYMQGMLGLSILSNSYRC